MDDSPRSEQGHGHGLDAEALVLLREAYCHAMFRGAASAAERVVAEALDAGLSEAAIGEQIITPAMRAVGERWAAGELSVEDEHVASGITMRMISLQRDHFRVQRRRGAHRVLLAAVEGEEHVLGLEMAASVLLHAGYDVRMLGPDVAPERLAEAVRHHRPEILGLTASTRATAAAVAAAITAAREVTPGLAVLVGGSVTQHLAPAGPDTAACPHVSDAVALADSLTQRAGLN